MAFDSKARVDFTMRGSVFSHIVFFCVGIVVALNFCFFSRQTSNGQSTTFNEQAVAVGNGRVKAQQAIARETILPDARSQKSKHAKFRRPKSSSCKPTIQVGIEDERIKRISQSRQTEFAATLLDLESNLHDKRLQLDEVCTCEVRKNPSGVVSLDLAELHEDLFKVFIQRHFS